MLMAAVWCFQRLHGRHCFPESIAGLARVHACPALPALPACFGGTDLAFGVFVPCRLRAPQVCSRDDWVWSAKARPRQNYVAVADNDGSVTLYQLIFSTVHGLYQVCDAVPPPPLRDRFPAVSGPTLPGCEAPHVALLKPCPRCEVPPPPLRERRLRACCVPYRAALCRTGTRTVTP
jgi:hypothetical protein